MGADPETKRWNVITGIAFAIAIALGAVMAYLTGEFFNALYTVLIVSGIYFAIYFYFHDDNREMGPSAADGAIMGAILLCGTGACGYVYFYTGSVPITAVGFIIVLVLAGLTMAIRNRRFL